MIYFIDHKKFLFFTNFADSYLIFPKSILGKITIGQLSVIFKPHARAWKRILRIERTEKELNFDTLYVRNDFYLTFIAILYYSYMNLSTWIQLSIAPLIKKLSRYIIINNTLDSIWHDSHKTFYLYWALHYL